MRRRKQKFWGSKPKRFLPVCRFFCDFFSLPKVEMSSINNMESFVPGESNIYEKVQLYDRRMMNLIWLNREKLFDNRDKTQQAFIKALYDGRMKGQSVGKRVITYKLSSSTAGKLGYGRYYGGDGSLETLEQDLRATLCSSLYTDIDIVNCHPVLIVQYAKRYFNLTLPYIQNYVDNRQAFFKKMYDEYDIEESIVKHSIIIILYNGAIKVNHRDSVDFVNNNKIPQDMLEMKKEIKKLYKAIKDTDLHKELHDHIVRLDKNIQGTFMSLIIQTEERKCLEAMIETLEDDQDLQVDVLSYDGCMTRGINNITDRILTETEEYVSKKTEYNIKLKIKEMIPIKFEEEDDSNTYENLKKKWEIDHFYFKRSNTLVEVTQTGINHYALNHAMEAFNNWITSDNELFLKKWRNDSTRRIVEHLVYKNREDCLPNEASLFIGFAYTNFPSPSDDERKEAVDLFRDINSALCNDEMKVTNHVEKIFADMLQNPFRKAGICIIFSSLIQGIGKDTLLGLIKRIIGRHTAHYIDDTDFWNNHDTKKEGAIMIYLEEACAGSNKAKSDALKARITSDTCSINPKNVGMYDVPNIARYFMSTNHPDPVKMEESDRRFMLINPSQRLKSANWADIHEKLNRPSWMRAIAEYLSQIDLTGWNPRDFPITEMKQDVMDLSVSSEKKFLEQWVCEEKDGLVGKDLYKLYKDFCIENELHFAQSSISFCKKIIPYKNTLFTVAPGGDKNNKHYFSIIKNP